MNDYEKTIEVLQNRVSALEHLMQPIGSRPTVRKWQPEGGEWYIGYGGGVVKLVTESAGSEFGLERDTQAQAQRAAVEMRRFNRLLALRDELCGDGVVNWENGKDNHYLYHWNGDAPKWRVSIDTYCRVQTPYFTSYDLAQKACDMLNSGEVEL